MSDAFLEAGSALLGNFTDSIKILLNLGSSIVGSDE